MAAAAGAAIAAVAEAGAAAAGAAESAAQSSVSPPHSSLVGTGTSGLEIIWFVIFFNYRAI